MGRSVVRQGPDSLWLTAHGGTRSHHEAADGPMLFSAAILGGNTMLGMLILISDAETSCPS